MRRPVATITAIAAAIRVAAICSHSAFAQALAGQSSAPPAYPTLPIILKWAPIVGEKGDQVPLEQSANERLSRGIHLERALDDDRTFVIRWRVLPDGPYPARPDLFRAEEYPSGIVHMGKRERTADIVIQTYTTGRPDWRREFKVVLSDAETGNPVLSPYMTPIELSFLVTGDLTCAPGRNDLCDEEPDGHAGPHAEGRHQTGKTAVEKPR